VKISSGAAFVPRVGGSSEDVGWIISFVHNEKTNTSQASLTVPHNIHIYTLVVNLCVDVVRI
jgi:carotenoid cleavage dioxygenase-like enzyme